MSAYLKVLEAIKGSKNNGHAEANRQNKISLAKAKKEIESMFMGAEK